MDARMREAVANAGRKQQIEARKAKQHAQDVAKTVRRAKRSI
jgi:hypothetical protein